MDPLRDDDIEVMRTTSPEERVQQAFALFHTGLRLERAALRARRPEASDADIEATLRAWLASNA